MPFEATDNILIAAPVLGGDGREDLEEKEFDKYKKDSINHPISKFDDEDAHVSLTYLYINIHNMLYYSGTIIKHGL